MAATGCRFHKHLAAPGPPGDHEDDHMTDGQLMPRDNLFHAGTDVAEGRYLHLQERGLRLIFKPWRQP